MRVPDIMTPDGRRAAAFLAIMGGAMVFSLFIWVALYLLGPRGEANEAVAAALGFFDSAGFRRFFKRWTGLLPSAVGR